MLIGMVVTIFLAIIPMKNIDMNNKRHKYMVLLGPFILGGILYLSIFLLTKDIPPGVCDGAAILGILFSFILIGIGILINIINIIYLIINNHLVKEGIIKYKKQIIIIIIIILIILFYRHSTEINRNISKDLGIKIPKSLEFQYKDTHGGFHGDGITLAKSNITQDNIQYILNKSKAEWNKIPMSKEINLRIFGGVENNINYSYDLAKDLNIEDIKSGYWIFLDRWGNKKEYTNGEELLDSNRYSQNFSLGIIDSDNNIFYYIKFDS